MHKIPHFRRGRKLVSTQIHILIVQDLIVKELKMGICCNSLCVFKRVDTLEQKNTETQRNFATLSLVVATGHLKP